MGLMCAVGYAIKLAPVASTKNPPIIRYWNRISIRGEGFYVARAEHCNGCNGCNYDSKNGVVATRYNGVGRDAVKHLINMFFHLLYKSGFC